MNKVLGEKKRPGQGLSFQFLRANGNGLSGSDFQIPIGKKQIGHDCPPPV
jgi:hypothetical protein